MLDLRDDGYKFRICQTHLNNLKPSSKPLPQKLKSSGVAIMLLELAPEKLFKKLSSTRVKNASAFKKRRTTVRVNKLLGVTQADKPA